jgi:integrase
MSDKIKGDRIKWDTELKGFGIRERDGRVSYIIQYRVGTKQRRLKIGSREKLSEAQARAAARRKLAEVELGRDPAGEKEQARKDAKLTFKTVAANYLAHKKALVRHHTFRYSVINLGVNPDEKIEQEDERPRRGPKRAPLRSLIALHGMPINLITRRDIAAELGEISRKHGIEKTRRVRSALSALYVWAMGEGLVDVNPVIGTNAPPPSAPRDRVLSDAELVAIWKATSSNGMRETDATRAYRANSTTLGFVRYCRMVRLLILTGLRKMEIGGLYRSEVDAQRRMIHLPGERCKNGFKHDVFLSDLAWEILTEQRWDARERVFAKGCSPNYLWPIQKTRLDERLGESVEPWVLHDIRRTVATKMGDLGVPPHIVEEVIGHRASKRGAFAPYNWATYQNEVRVATLRWSDHVQALVEGTEPKVVTLKRA